jgi:hypothetical protein
MKSIPVVNEEGGMELKDTLRYELPPEGISLLGYGVRRMHKTKMLADVPRLVDAGETAAALGQVAAYTAAASTSFGRAYYQPAFNSEGEQVCETDPTTGAQVTAKLEANRPHILVSYTVEMPDRSYFTGFEEITGTIVGLRGLGMPAPSEFHYRSGDYTATLKGTITSELVLWPFGRTRIRAYGWLRAGDSTGHAGRVEVERGATARIEIDGQFLAEA